MRVCECGHTREEHGGDPECPGSTTCRAVVSLDEGLDEECYCIAFVVDPEADLNDPVFLNLHTLR
jgi:hypothetical protein